MGDRIKGGSKKKPDNIKFPGFGKKPNQEIKKEENCEEGTEEHVGEEGDDNSSTTTKSPDSGNDSISVSSPEDDAAIAEAKPVGLAIAGIGGVASSKPVINQIVI